MRIHSSSTISTRVGRHTSETGVEPWEGSVCAVFVPLGQE